MRINEAVQRLSALSSEAPTEAFGIVDEDRRVSLLLTDATSPAAVNVEHVLTALIRIQGVSGDLPLVAVTYDDDGFPTTQGVEEITVESIPGEENVQQVIFSH